MKKVPKLTTMSGRSKAKGSAPQGTRTLGYRFFCKARNAGDASSYFQLRMIVSLRSVLR